MGLGYNIPVSLSSSLADDSGGPFSDDTFINFSGGQTAIPANSQTENLTPVATSSAAEGDAAAASTLPAPGTGNTQATPSQYNTPSLIGGIETGGDLQYVLIAAGAIAAYLIFRNYVK
jgi:hypothetical protein